MGRRCSFTWLNHSTYDGAVALNWLSNPGVVTSNAAGLRTRSIYNYHLDLAARATAMQIGPVAFFIKPFNDEEFLAAVHDALAIAKGLKR